MEELSSRQARHASALNLFFSRRFRLRVAKRAARVQAGTEPRASNRRRQHAEEQLEKWVRAILMPRSWSRSNDPRELEDWSTRLTRLLLVRYKKFARRRFLLSSIFVLGIVI